MKKILLSSIIILIGITFIGRLSYLQIFSFSPDQVLEEKEKQNILREALDSLPPNQKAAFILHKYENMSYREISEILGISLSAAEARIHRARSNLRRKILVYLKKN